MADRTDLFGYLAAAGAFRADSSLLDVAKNSSGNGDYLAGTITLITGLELMARLDGRTLTMLAAVFNIELELYLRTKDCLFEAVAFELPYFCLAT